MPTMVRKVWLTFEGACRDLPCIWQLSQKYPQVKFDIRQASISDQIGIMAIKFEGESQQVEDALAYLTQLGVRIDPVEGGSNVAG